MTVKSGGRVRQRMRANEIASKRKFKCVAPPLWAGWKEGWLATHMQQKAAAGPPTMRVWKKLSLLSLFSRFFLLLLLYLVCASQCGNCDLQFHYILRINIKHVKSTLLVLLLLILHTHTHIQAHMYLQRAEISTGVWPFVCLMPKSLHYTTLQTPTHLQCVSVISSPIALCAFVWVLSANSWGSGRAPADITA